MKAFLILLFMATTYSDQAMTHSERLCKKIASFIMKQYPTAKSIRLLEVSQGYKTMFKIAGVKYVSFFSEEGHWIQTEKKIKLADVSDSIMQSLKSTKYRNAKILAAKEIMDSNGLSPFCILRIRNVTDSTPNPEYYKLYFTSQGLLEKEEIEVTDELQNIEWGGQ